MTMLAPETHSLDIPRIDDEIYNLVDYFYPRTDFMQVLQLYLDTDDIMNIMNCDSEEAFKLYYEIRHYFGEEYMRVLIPHFCHYMGVDEAFIHLFLASLKKHQTFKPEKKSKEASLVNDPSVVGRPLSLAQVIENISKGIEDSPETIKERLRQWDLANPYGEPHYKRDDNWRVFIYPDEVASILQVSHRKAQKALKELREDCGITAKKPVSIKKFCTYFNCEETDVRKAIAVMYGEEYIAE